MSRPLALLVLVSLALAPGAQAGDPRVVNGLVTAADPAVGALLYQDPDDGLYFSCSGTLVGCSTFITAAHCVCDDDSTDNGQCEAAAAAEAAVQKVYLQHAGILDIASIAVHPGWEFEYRNDVAVVTLAEPVTGIAPVALNRIGTPPPGTAAVISGFGTSDDVSGDAGIKRRGIATVGTCQGVDAEPAYICWEYAGAGTTAAGSYSNTCYGDSGGPLFADLGAGMTLAGITSGGDKCRGPGFSTDANVYDALAFIDSVAAGDLGAERCGDGPQVGEAGVAVTEISDAIGYSDPTMRCRRAVRKGLAKYLKTATKLTEKCIYKVTKGASQGPCPDTRAQAKIAKAAAKLSAAKLSKRCRPAHIQAMTLAGACQGASDPGGLAACLTGAAGAASDQMVDSAHAVRDAAIADKAGRKCQQTLAKMSAKYALKRQKLLDDCNEWRDWAVWDDEVIECPGPDYTPDIERMRERLVVAANRRCTAADIAGLEAAGGFGGSCAGVAGLADMLLCLRADHDSAVDAVTGVLEQAKHDYRATVSVAEGVATLRVTLNSSEQEGSVYGLYLAHGQLAGPGDDSSQTQGQAQFIEIDSPAAGTWHLLVDRISGVGAFQVVATVGEW